MKKIVTLSFDDGEIYDMQLTQLLRKYHLAATFYLCSGFDGEHGVCKNGRPYQKMRLCDIEATYRGFEIGSHSFLHRGVGDANAEALRENIEKDIDLFSQYSERPVCCFAYPGGVATQSAINTLSAFQPIRFARTVPTRRRSFLPPENPYCCIPTAHIFDPDMDMIISSFKSIDSNQVQVLHIFGHSYEIAYHCNDGWERMNQLFRRLAAIDAQFLCNADAYDIVFNSAKKK